MVKKPITQIQYQMTPKVFKNGAPELEISRKAYSIRKLKPCCITVSSTLRLKKILTER